MNEIIKSRITPPGITGNIVHRVRLLNLLKDNVDKSLLLICSSAGFGKTTLVRDFLSSIKESYAWYYTTSDINNFYSFFTYVINSFDKVSNGFGKNTLQLINSICKSENLSKNYKANIKDIVATFVNEFITHFDNNVFLVIDDLHNIDSGKNGEWLNCFFDVLFENLPSNLRIFITTREIPGFNINLLKAKRRIFQLKNEDLVFSEEEIAELLDDIYSITSTEEEIEILRTNINGWITGIHLIIQAYGENFKNAKLSDRLNYEDIFNYFARDIFDKLEKDTKDFLLGTAVLENFNSILCDDILKIKNSERIIRELVNKNIFIQLSGTRMIDGENFVNQYCYQELFKIFLFEKLKEMRTKEQLTSEFKILFNYYLENNDIISAINFGLKAGDYTSVIPLIILNYRSLFDRGNCDILWRWVITIPNEIVKTNPFLLYLTGLLNFYFHSDPQSSLQYSVDALQIAQNINNISMIVDCSILKTDSMLLLGMTEEPEKDLYTVLSLGISIKDRAKILYSISRILYRKGFLTYNKILELLTEALEICNEEKLHILKNDIFYMLGNIYHDWGDMVKAIYYFEQALLFDTDVYKIFRVMNNIIGDYCILGNFTKAKEFLDRTSELYKSFPSLFFKRFLLRSGAGLRFDCADYKESIKRFNELSELEMKNSITHYIGNQYMVIGEANYYLKKYDTALKYFEIALNYIDKHNEYFLLLNKYFYVKLFVKLKPRPDTEKILLETLDFHVENNILVQKSQIEFHLADFYLRSGQPVTALKYLKNCLDTSADKQYISFLEQEIANSRHLFDFAIANNIQKQFIRSIIEYVRDKINYEWLSEDCKKRLALEIKSLTDLKLFSFGKTEILLRGNPIPEEKWVRKKSKIILAYMLTKPERVLNKNKIIDLFFQDVPLDSVDTIFHNAISNIRIAVKINSFKPFEGITIEKNKGTSKTDLTSNFIIYEDKNLSLNMDFQYESDCLEFEKLYNAVNSASIKEKKKIELSEKAIDLYKGEFMPGYYEPWCEDMRQTYSGMYLKLLEGLINTYYYKSDYKNILKHSEKLLEVDKLNSEAYLKLIESHVKLNNLITAKEKFALMLKNFEEELGEKPDKQVLSRIYEFLNIN